MTDFQVEVKGMAELQAAFEKFPHRVQEFIGKASLEIASDVIRTRGLASYPPSTYRNNLNRGYPYYIRGRGTQTSATHNMENSQRYGSQWSIEGVPYGVRIGNDVSYAPYLAGNNQVEWAGNVGWRKLMDVAKEKMQKIVNRYNKAIRDLLVAIGLEVK